MATYNGQKYLKLQLDSIISQLRFNDELIILDDCSTDTTVEIISKYLKDSRIKLYQNPNNIGHVKTFSKLLSLANYDFIIMSDQDDIWVTNRLKILYSTIVSKNISLVTSNCLFIDDFGNYIKDPLYTGVKMIDSKKYFKNILDVFFGRQQYLGCLMIIERNLLRIALPIPNYVESHDLWLAFTANIMKSNFHIEDYSLLRRLHGHNASVGVRPFLKKIKSRVIFIFMIIHIYIRFIKIQILNVRYNSNKFA